jgi:lysine-N-methylase
MADLHLLTRPRLAAHVVARRYFADDKPLVVLTDTRTSTISLVGEREWSVLRCCDGTRDQEGIIAAAARLNVRIAPNHLDSFLADLDSKGMLALGISRDSDAPEAFSPAFTSDQLEALHSERRDLPLVPLEGYRFTCHGQGACCDIFPTVLFSSEEALRARALCPQILDGGQREELVFTPERSGLFDGPGSSFGARAATTVDGICAFHEPAQGCRIHAAGGVESKPLGCRTFPLIFVDDGEAIRVSVAPDCACVFDSIGRDDGEQLLPSSAHTGADLAPALYVRSVPEVITLRSGRSVSRAQYVAWDLHTLWFVRQRRLADVARCFAALADAVERHGLAISATEAALGDPRPFDLDRLVDEIWQLRSWWERQPERCSIWRNKDDLVRVTIRLVHRACDLLIDELSAGAVPTPEGSTASETLYLEVMLHGHLLLDEQSLVLSLRQRALRLLIARMVPRLLETEELKISGSCSLRQPLSLIEPMIRIHGPNPLNLRA